MSEANDMTAELMKRVPERFPGAAVWRANRFKGKAVRKDGRMGMVDAGINGQADLTGFVPVHGLAVRCEIEIKAGKDRLSPAQIAFQNLISLHNGIYVVCRDVDTCLELIAAAVVKLTIRASMTTYPNAPLYCQ